MTFFSQIFIFQAFCLLIYPNPVLAHQLGFKSIFYIVSIKTIYTTECFNSLVASASCNFILAVHSSCSMAHRPGKLPQKLSSKPCDYVTELLTHSVLYSPKQMVAYMNLPPA